MELRRGWRSHLVAGHNNSSWGCDNHVAHPRLGGPMGHSSGNYRTGPLRISRCLRPATDEVRHGGAFEGVHGKTLRGVAVWKHLKPSGKILEQNNNARTNSPVVARVNANHRRRRYALSGRTVRSQGDSIRGVGSRGLLAQQTDPTVGTSMGGQKERGRFGRTYPSVALARIRYYQPEWSPSMGSAVGS